jgi:hypothetical protein
MCLTPLALSPTAENARYNFGCDAEQPRRPVGTSNAGAEDRIDEQGSYHIFAVFHLSITLFPQEAPWILINNCRVRVVPVQ